MDYKDLERKEFTRQNDTINFIASENYPNEEILDANSSIFMCKYAEGFSHKRYYQGVDVADELEDLTQHECLKMLKAEGDYNANVQMSSGCQANITVYHALLEKGDTVLGPDTASMGHISHGIKGSFLDTYFNVVKYGLNKDNIIDYDDVERIALECKPKLIICGASNYNKKIDFKRFSEIAKKVGAYLMADISHILGLVVTENHMSPVGYADVITSTLHKTLKGVRGAIIVYKKCLDKKIKYSTIPGLWGGSHLNNTLAKLYTFTNAQTPEFTEYIKNVMNNTSTMCKTFLSNNIPVVGGETENHVFCLNLTDFINGKFLAELLEDCGIIANANAIPNDTSFIKPHGVRFGCAPCTARGVTRDEIENIANIISKIIKCFKNDTQIEDTGVYVEELKNAVKLSTEKHPLKNIYPNKYNSLF